MPSIAICASRNASTLPVMLYCLRASASAISQARSVASAIRKLVDIGHQFIPAGIHPGFLGLAREAMYLSLGTFFKGSCSYIKQKGDCQGDSLPLRYDLFYDFPETPVFPYLTEFFRVDTPSQAEGRHELLTHGR